MLPLPGISSNLAHAQAKPAAAKPKARPGAAAAAPAAPAAAAPADPNVHYQKGVDHFAAGRYDEAIVEFKLAYAAGGPAALLFNIAQAHRSAGHAEEALAYYKEYLRVLPDAPNREDVEARMATIRKDLEVESETARAAAEAARQPKPSEPAGTTATEPVPGAGVGSPDGRTVAPYSPGKKLKRAGIAVLGGGAVLFGLGIYFGVQAVNATDELDARAARGSPWTAHEQAIYDRGERDETIGTSLVVVGAASLLTGAVFLWIGSEQEQEAREFALVPVPGGAQMVMAWDF